MTKAPSTLIAAARQLAPRSTQGRLGIACISLTLAAAGVASGARLLMRSDSFRPVARHIEAGPCLRRPPPPGETPLRVAARFLASAVEREQLALSYPLVTDAIRQGMSCRQWLTGAIAVQPFEHIVSPTVFQLVQRSARQRIFLVTLLSYTRDAGEQAFLLELERHNDTWLVNSFMPALMLAYLGASHSPAKVVIPSPDALIRQLAA